MPHGQQAEAIASNGFNYDFCAILLDQIHILPTGLSD